MDMGTGPPEKEGPAADEDRSDRHVTPRVDFTCPERQPEPCQGRGAELLAQLQRRRAAALRLPKLASGHRDPLTAAERALARKWAR